MYGAQVMGMGGGGGSSVLQLPGMLEKLLVRGLLEMLVVLGRLGMLGLLGLGTTFAGPAGLGRAPGGRLGFGGLELPAWGWPLGLAVAIPVVRAGMLGVRGVIGVLDVIAVLRGRGILRDEEGP